MPTYEYKCDTCGHLFEKVQSMNDEPIKKCESCGAPVRKLFGSAGIIFKGSGFYVNDYKGSSQKTSSKSSTGNESTPSTSGETVSSSAD